MKTFTNAKHPIKAWVDGVEFEPAAKRQVENMASLPFIHSHVAVMPDVHVGIGATVGSVIPTIGAIVPAAVGVDIGCGMVAQRLTLRQEDLPDNLAPIRDAIERAIPVGFAAHKEVPAPVATVWTALEATHNKIMTKYPKIDNRKATQQLGTMGGGNHFCELTVDTEGFVWLVIHSGSRGIGNRIGTFFIERAKREMEKLGVSLIDRDLAYLTENTESFNDYVEAVDWAQSYARANRDLMVGQALRALGAEKLGLPAFDLKEKAVNCHHNYVAREHHLGADVYVTRKGAVRAGTGDLGIIPGSMGAHSYIVRGKGNPDSFESCSHGAGRRMGRKEAERRLTLADLQRETAGIECRKDAGVLDEAPSAYKSIRAVMAAQADLVDIVHEFRQVVCVKG
jgi:tRNA-splicing ligase RtcB (3'-phosphate/5'-hydroxy nucleic acid ligase)